MVSTPPPPPPPPSWGPGPIPADVPKPTSGMPPYAPYPGYGETARGGWATWQHPSGTTVMVLGILSLVFCGLLGPVAWIMGNRAMREISQRSGTCTNQSQIVAGRICGMIASAILALGLVGLILLVAAGS